MIGILKPFAEWVTASKNNTFQTAILKLTFFYVLGTAIILCVSSVAVLAIFAPPETVVPFHFEEQKIDEPHEEWSTYELQEHLAGVIFIVDMTILLLVSIVSYYFARITLAPIKRADTQQRQFMGDVAHELRTPLSVIQIGAETLLRRERRPAEYEDFIRDVYEEVGRLTRLSNQLLQLVRTSEARVVVFREENISDIAAKEIIRFAPYAAEHGVSMISQIQPAVLISTERDSVVEVLQNILKNAIDYTRGKGTVTVSVLNTEAALVLVVHDTGVGMSADQQEKAFQRFVKSDSARTQTHTSGAGLGLSIVKALVTRLGGVVSLESGVGAGTTVTVSLPHHHS